MSLTWFDIFILIIVVFSLIKGFMSGLVMQLSSLIGLIVCAFFAGQVATFITPYLLSVISADEYITKPLAYLLAFLIIIFAVMIIGKAIDGFFKAIMLGFVNRLAGAVFSIAKWILLISILLNLLIGFDKNQTVIKPDVRENSLTFSHIQKIAPHFIPFLDFDFLQSE